MSRVALTSGLNWGGLLSPWAGLEQVHVRPAQFCGSWEVNKMQRKMFIRVVGAGVLLCAQSLRAAPDSAGIEFFEKKIRPIFVEHCYECHSADAKKVKGGLLLDTRDSTLKGGDNGPAIVPGNPDKSLMIKAVRYTDEDLQMPPKK